MNGPELPAKDSGQPILNTCQITIKDSLSGMVLTLSRKRSSLAGIQKLLSGRSSNPDHAVCTDLLDDGVADILKVSEGRWQIEDCFRTMKTDFEARPVYLNREDRIKAHFLTCFLALFHFRLLNRSLKGTYTTEQLLHTLKDIKFADIEEQGFMPVYERQEITDDLHETCGFRTDYQFITKRKMKGIQKKSKRR